MARRLSSAHKYICGIEGEHWIDFFMVVPRWGRYAHSSVEKFNDLAVSLRDKSAGQAVQLYVKLVNDINVKRFEETVKRSKAARDEQDGKITRQNERGDTVFTMGLLPKPLGRVLEALNLSVGHTFLPTRHRPIPGIPHTHLSTPMFVFLRKCLWLCPLCVPKSYHRVAVVAYCLCRTRPTTAWRGSQKRAPTRPTR